MKTKNIRFLLISMLTIIFITSCSSPTSTPESINIYGDEVYIVCNNKEYNGGIVYKLNFNEIE